jgi:superfamily I DNA/RNA helicase
MDAMQELLKVVEDFKRHIGGAAEDGKAEPLEAYLASEYLIFVQAFDVYSRHLEDTIRFKIETLVARREALTDPAVIADIDRQLTQLEAHQENPVDKVVQAGVRLMKRLDSEMAEFTNFMRENLPEQFHNKLDRTMRKPARDPQGVALRARGLRGVVMRGGPKTLKGLFGSKIKLRNQNQEALAAVQMDDGDEALKKLAAIPVKHALIRKWISWADETAKPLKAEEFFPEFVSPTEIGASEVSDRATTLVSQQSRQLGATDPEEVQEAKVARDETIVAVEQEATAKAQEALEKAGEPDEPPKKSEVVGIATAAALTAITDLSNPQNVPNTLKGLDDEQRAAALTDGKVLVAAAAGSGKTRTAVARISHLVLDRGVPPTKILAATFNKKAGKELSQRLVPTLGQDVVKQMEAAGKLGTLHSTFRRVIKEHGNFDEQMAISKAAFQGGGDKIGRWVNKVWGACYGPENIPKLSDMMRYKTQWAGNDISPEQALAEAENKEESQAALWYGWYENFKKANPGEWAPPCEGKQQEANQQEARERRQRRRRPTQWETFLNNVRTVQYKGRPKTVRVGDFDDMLSMARDILRRNPEARKQIQSGLDHVIVDEGQDQNTVQHEVIGYMTEHVASDGSDGRSLWVVGDESQSIYSFRGARPDQFVGLHENEEFTTRAIKTNYRCEPEIVGAANKLIENNEDRLPIAANANPARQAGNASIKVSTPEDEASAAISVIDRVKSLVDRPDGDEFNDHAVLTRTNAELNAYETACIIGNVPYQRKGGGGFLESPETKAVLGYVDLVMGSDHEKMQESFASVIDRPQRFFRGTDGPELVKGVFREYARRIGEDVGSISPMVALNDSTFVRMLSEALSKSSRAVGHGISKIEDLRDSLMDMQAHADEGGSVEDLFDDILDLKGRVPVVDEKTGRSQFKEVSLRESIQGFTRDNTSEDDEGGEGDADDSMVGLGNVSFLFLLTEPDPTDPADIAQSPKTPAGFKAKMARYEERAKSLRVPTEEERAAALKQGKVLPEAPTNFMSLNTVHATKGLEWKNVYVSMPGSKFPMPLFTKENEPPPPVEKEQKQLESERRLGYVAITRAEKNLTILCPKVVGGRPSGVSRFVEEAGLEVGENVNPPGEAGDAAAEVEKSTTRTASVEWYDEETEDDIVMTASEWSKDVCNG